MTQFLDWASHTIFSSHLHCFLAIIAEFGDVFSRLYPPLVRYFRFLTKVCSAFFVGSCIFPDYFSICSRVVKFLINIHYLHHVLNIVFLVIFCRLSRSFCTAFLLCSAFSRILKMMSLTKLRSFFSMYYLRLISFPL